MEFRKLKAEEIEVRVGSVHSRGFTLLLYKDARVDMQILDETVGPLNWQRDHKEIKGTVYCGVGLRDPGRDTWIWKWDAGAETYTEKEKGEASDSFKRACVNWSIGRELYTAPFISINAPTEKAGNGYKLTRKGDAYGFKVAAIEYEGDRISYLELEKDGRPVWSMQKIIDEPINASQFRRLVEMAKAHGKGTDWILEVAGAPDAKSITASGYTAVVRAIEEGSDQWQ